MKNIYLNLKRLLRSFILLEKNKINYEEGVRLLNPNIKVGRNVKLYSGVHILGSGKITIDDNVSIGKDTIIFSNSEIHIGKDTLIAAQCYIIDSDHGISNLSIIREQKLISEKIDIGEDVWIGAGVKVLKGSVIAKGSIVGAMSLVNKSTVINSVNIGIPAKQISFRK